MLTRRARLLVFAVALILLSVTIYLREFELTAVIGAGILYLIWSYYRQGTVVLAAKAYHQKDYTKTATLLAEIKDPDKLASNRRGYYEFISGNIELWQQNFEAAERHFQLASRFKLRSENDKAIVLVQLANINLRKRDFTRASAYADKAKDLKVSSRVQDIIKKIEREIQKQSDR